MNNMVISSAERNVFLPEVVEKAVILLHGFGSCGSDMFGLVPELAESLPNTAFFCPNAGEKLPSELHQRGSSYNDEESYQWFPLLDELQIVSMGRVEDFQELAYTLQQKAQPAYRALKDYTAKIKASYNLSDTDIAFAGFSQGADIAIGAAFSQKSAVAAVVGFSPMTSYFYMGDIVSEPQFLLIYGDKDDVIPPSVYKMTLDVLRQNKIPYEKFVMKDCGHFINDDAIKVATAFLKKNLFR